MGLRERSFSARQMAPLSSATSIKRLQIRLSLSRFTFDGQFDNRAIRTKFTLNEPFRLWSPARGLTKVTDLREALNRIVHATEFEVGFDQLPDAASEISGGAIGVIYLRTKTDKREEALIDVFALASSFSPTPPRHAST